MFIYFTFLCIGVCAWVGLCAQCACRNPWRSKEETEYLELEIVVTVSSHRVKGTEPGSSRKAARPKRREFWIFFPMALPSYLFFFHLSCVYMWVVCACVCTDRCVCVCLCMWEPKADVGSHPSLLFYLIHEVGPQTAPRAHWYEESW